MHGHQRREDLKERWKHDSGDVPPSGVRRRGKGGARRAMRKEREEGDNIMMIMIMMMMMTQIKVLQTNKSLKRLHFEDCSR